MALLLAALCLVATACGASPQVAAGTRTGARLPTPDDAGSSLADGTAADAASGPSGASAAPSAFAGALPLSAEGVDLSPVGTFGGVPLRMIVGPDAIATVVVDGDDEPTALVAVDRTGSVLAERPALPGGPDAPPRVTAIDGALAFIDGDASTWQVLDPISLDELGSFEIEAGPQTVSGGDRTSGLALAHWRSNGDLDRGVRTAQAATITDVTVLDAPADDGSRIATDTRRWELPTCGGRDIAIVDGTPFATVRCSWLLAELGTDGTIAAFHPMHRGEAWVEPHDGSLYLSYRNLGIVSRFDPISGATVSVQVELTPGQLLRDPRFAAGSVWIIAENTTGTGPTTLLRFSEDLAEVTVLDMTGWRGTVGWDDEVAWFSPDTGGLVPVAYDDLTLAPVPTLAIDPPLRLEAQQGRTTEIVALEERFAPIFDPTTPKAALVGVLERADELETARQEVASFVTEDLFGAELVVQTFVPRGDEGVATFTFTVDGAPLLDPQVIRLVAGEDGWMVPAASFCDAIAVLFIDCPIPV